MNDESRREFLDSFYSQDDHTTVGILVLGGIFSEGIDLVGDKLIGSIIISVGLPQISFEKDCLKNYYDIQEEGNEKKDSQKGFKYAYNYPGINKVLQAAGRVIRSENDKGFMLFIDTRYRYSLYKEIFDEIYPDRIDLKSNAQLKLELIKFWKENDK